MVENAVSLLLDPLPKDSLALVKVVAKGYAISGQWPIWQWVAHQLRSLDLDPEDVTRTMPAWGYGYKPLRTFASGSIPQPGDSAILTILGMHHSEDPRVAQLVDIFVAALAELVTAQDEAIPTPTHVVPVAVDVDTFTDRVVKRGGRTALATDLLEILTTEPTTWSLNPSTISGKEVWDISRLRLWPYRHVRNGEEYLVALEELVGIPSIPRSNSILPSMALPEAFDHLDLTWRLVTNGPGLLHVPRATMPAQLALPVRTAEEFASRCSALADLLNNLRVSDSPPPSLQALKTRLEELLGKQAGRAQEAVDTLRQILAVRAGQQHRGADLRAEKARAALGLTQYQNDWASAWEHLRSITVSACTIIREEIGIRLDSQ